MPWLSSHGDDEVLRRAAHVLVGAVLLQLPEHVGDVLEADQQVVDHLGLEVAGDARDQAASSPRCVMTIGDGGSRPCCASLFSLKCVSRAAISLPVTKRQPPCAVRDHGAEAVGVGVGGQDQVGLCAPRPVAAARSIDSGTSGFGVLRDVGELAVRRHLLRDGDDAEALADQHLHRRHRADAVQRREDDLESRRLRRRHQALLAAQVDVGLVRRLVEEVDAAAAHRLGPGQAP